MVDVFQELKQYLPVITAFLGATFAYIFSNRKYKLERFHIEVVDSLKDFYSPTFHEMRNIKLNMDNFKEGGLLQDKEKLLNDFIKKHIKEDTQLYKSFNRKLIDLFYELDESLIKYSIDKDEELMKKCLEIFNQIYYLVEKEYWDIQKSLYKQYPWYKQLNKRSFIVRFLMDVSYLFYDTIQFITIVWAFLLYMIIVDRITGEMNTPSIIYDNFKGMTVIVLSIYFLAVTIRMPYYFITLDYKKENKFFQKANEKIERFLGKVYIKMKDMLKNIAKTKNIKDN